MNSLEHKKKMNEVKLGLGKKNRKLKRKIIKKIKRDSRKKETEREVVSDNRKNLETTEGKIQF